MNIKKIINKETILYLFFGVLTTLINYVSFFLFYNVMQINELIANTIAFIFSLIFAFVVNKLFVFESKGSGFKQLLAEATSFAGSRVFTFAIETAGLWICGYFAFSHTVIMQLFGKTIDGITVAKLMLSVIVVILNYVFCKFLVFKKKK